MSKRRAWWRDRWLWYTLAAGLPVAAAYAWMQALSTPGLATLVLLVLVYPLLEEVAFRGLIQPALLEPTRRLSVGPLTLANGLSSALFATLHLLNHPPLHALLVFFPSLIFGGFRDRSGSVGPGIVLHVSWNGAVMVTPLAYA